MKKRTLLAAAILLMTGTIAAKASSITLEIFSLSHRPAQAVVNKLEQYLVPFKNLTIKKYDFEDPKAQSLLQKYGVHSHTPVAIFINGKNTFTVKGKPMTLVNFPKGDAFVPSFEGSWRYEDVVSILRDMTQK